MGLRFGAIIQVFYKPSQIFAELKAAGDNNVSFVRFPWLWGQEHAVVNEHAGFANILASHLATELGLPQPPPSNLSSFAPHGELKNASFEKRDCKS